MTITPHEFLPDGTGVVDEEGDIRSLADYFNDTSSDDPRERQLQDILRSVHLYEASVEFAVLAKRGSKDPSVKRIGGVHECENLARQKGLEARETYIVANGYIAEEPAEGASDAEFESYYAGVNAWALFRNEIASPDQRGEIISELENQLQG